MTINVLSDVAIISPIFVYPISLPMNNESTVREDIYPTPALIELNEPNDVVRFRIAKLLAYPVFVEIVDATKKLVLREIVLRF